MCQSWIRISYTKNAAKLQHQCYSAIFEGSWLNSWSRLLVRTARVGRPAPRILERLTGRHFLDRLEEGGKSLHRQCIVCGPAEREMLPPMRSGEKRPSRCGHLTSYKCKQCNVPLCITPCFEIYHTKQEHILAYKRMKLTSED